MLHRFFKHIPGSDSEECYYFDLADGLTDEAKERIRFLLDQPGALVTRHTFFEGVVIEVGPRLSMETPFSSNAIQILSSIGIRAARVEVSRRYPTPLKRAYPFDPMTQMVYDTPLTSFESGVMPESVRSIDVLGHGADALNEANIEFGLGMDKDDIEYYVRLFTELGRNPTDVECFQLGNANSEHSRHWRFRGKQVIDGIEMPETLMEIVQDPWRTNPGDSLVAFHDNAGVLRGVEVPVIVPRFVGEPSPYDIVYVLQHYLHTAETHNHPTMFAPFEGATTGSGGRIRDNRAVGRGATKHFGFAGYSVGNLFLEDFEIPGEVTRLPAGYRHASASDILIKGSDGVSDYGNKIGEPLIGGFSRSFGQMVNDVHVQYAKPVLYSAGQGRIFDANLLKRSPEIGMLVVRIGGPAYRIGIGGGSASSMIGGSSSTELDLKSVQRGNAEMENRVNRVIQTCADMRDKNPIESIHDQGAGGPSNVIPELLEPVGGRVDIRKIILGDTTMSVLEIWGAEYQEGYGLLVKPESREEFVAICARERVNCEILGEITGDGHITLFDSRDDTTPVHLNLKHILSEMPQKTFVSERLPKTMMPLSIPEGISVKEMLANVWRLLSVCSKGFLTRKVDRSVTGRVARQQCCGPEQLPVADAGVTADGYFGLTGAVSAIGEQPLPMLIDSAKGARLALAEMLTNMVSTRITALEKVRFRANWMLAAKLPGQGAILYDAASALRDMAKGLELKIAADGGKDSLSMAVQADELIMSPAQLVIFGTAPVPDITSVCTPDFKRADSSIGYLRIGDGVGLGGSALAQALNQLGDECADVNPRVLGIAFKAIQELIARGLITACHDVSDGGGITAIGEMCLAGNRGAHITVRKDSDVWRTLFNQVPAVIFEYDKSDLLEIRGVLGECVSRFRTIGTTLKRHESVLRITRGATTVLECSLTELRLMWEATSTRLELEQSNPATVREEERSFADTGIPDYRIPFTPRRIVFDKDAYRPKVAIIREEGTNGDDEMIAVCREAGLDPWNINMQDILSGAITSFEDFKFMIFPGGFSFADVFGSAKGWAAVIRFNPRVREMFRAFFERKDTLSLGVCNGCQLMALLGIVYPELDDSQHPILVHNTSGRFESRWVTVGVKNSHAYLLRGMEKTRFGIWVAHGEGRFHFKNAAFETEVRRNGLAPIVYLDDVGEPTTGYPYNPNGSPRGFAALVSRDGRHLAMMPHPERCYLPWQCSWLPEELRAIEASPWLRMFQNAREWCLQN